MRAPKTVALSLSLLVGGCDQRPVPAPRQPTTAAAVATESATKPLCGPTESPLRPVGPSKSGSVVLARTAKRDLAFLADSDDGAVIAVDAESGEEVSRLDLDSAVEHVLVAPDGRVVASLADRDQIAVLGWENGAEGEGLVARCTREVVGEPSGMAMSGDRLLVASRWTAEVHELDGATLSLRRTFPVGRDPYAVAFREEGEAIVTHVVGGRVSRIRLEDGSVEALDASRVDHKGGRTMKKEPMLPPSFQSGSMLSTGSFRPRPSTTIRAHRLATHAYAIAVAPDGRAFIPASLADGSESPVATGYGGGGSGIRPHAGVTLVVDDAGVDVPRGSVRRLVGDCQLPHAAAWDPQEELLYVACRGIDAIHLYDQRGGHRDRHFGRIDVPPGPTGVAIDLERRRLVVWSQFSAQLATVALPIREPAEGVTIDPETMARRWSSTQVEVARHRPVPAAVARGRELFHQAGPKRRIAFDGRACASCHPDGRDDAISWATVEGPRQTPILMGRLEGTAPFGWNGRRDEVQSHLERTLARLQGTGLNEQEREDILAYIGAMRAPRHGVGDSGALVERGAALYADDEVGCASCHPTGAGTTDGLTHELGPRNAKDHVVDFDTPSLRFVAQSAPYFHDGRYDSLDALLADPESGMGHSASLSGEDQRALKAYLQTL